jgi:uncharacterized protein (TIGR00156 family)
MKRRDVMMAIPMAVLVGPAAAQFMGPEVSGVTATAAAANAARPGTYLTMTGNIVSHLREDYFLFRDATGELRVEIDNRVFRNQPVTPETTVRIHGEIDRDTRGRYMWVKTLDVVS